MPGGRISSTQPGPAADSMHRRHVLGPAAAVAERGAVPLHAGAGPATCGRQQDRSAAPPLLRRARAPPVAACSSAHRPSSVSGARARASARGGRPAATSTICRARASAPARQITARRMTQRMPREALFAREHGLRLGTGSAPSRRRVSTSTGGAPTGGHSRTRRVTFRREHWRTALAGACAALHAQCRVPRGRHGTGQGGLGAGANHAAARAADRRARRHRVTSARPSEKSGVVEPAGG